MDGDADPGLQVKIDGAVERVEHEAEDEGPEVALAREEAEAGEGGEREGVDDEGDELEVAEDGVGDEGEAEADGEAGLAPAVTEDGVDEGEAGDPPEPAGATQDERVGLGDDGLVEGGSAAVGRLAEGDWVKGLSAMRWVGVRRGARQAGVGVASGKRGAESAEESGGDEREAGEEHEVGDEAEVFLEPAWGAGELGGKRGVGGFALRALVLASAGEVAAGAGGEAAEKQPGHDEAEADGEEELGGGMVQGGGPRESRWLRRRGGCRAWIR